MQNVIHDISGEGIVAEGSSNAIIENRVFDTDQDGIVIAPTATNTFVGNNKIKDSEQSGIEIFNNFHILERNKITDNEDSGLKINAGSTGNLILRNDVDDNDPRNITDNEVNNNYVQNDED